MGTLRERGLAPTDAREVVPSLEDVFVALVREQERLGAAAAMPGANS
jgi:hypothetical protein